MKLILEIDGSNPYGKGKILFRLCLGMLVSLALLSCTQKDSNSNTTKGDKARVVATSTIIADLAQEVAGDEIQLSGILKPGTDPHVYEPVPADSRVLEEADLILYNGYNLEPGLIKLMNASGGKAQKLAVGEVVKSLQLEKGKGEVVPDPHVWGSGENAIERVGMSEYCDRPIGQLSGGQQQRVFLARALTQEAEIFCFDEPLVGIDQKTQAVIFEVFHELAADNKIVLVVNHDLGESITHFDDLILLNRELIATGSRQQVLTQNNLNLAYGGKVMYFSDAA